MSRAAFAALFFIAKLTGIISERSDAFRLIAVFEQILMDAVSGLGG